MQRALAIKLVIIVLLAFVMLVPLDMIQSKINERAMFRLEAAKSIQRSWTGPQTVMTPVLQILYTVSEKHSATSLNGFVVDAEERRVEKRRILHPDRVSVAGKVDTQTLSRGIYQVPVYRSRLSLEGVFASDRVQHVLNEIRQLPGNPVVQQSQLSIYIADARGISNSALVQWNQSAIAVEPGSGLQGLSEGMHAPLPPLEADTDLTYKLGLDLRGMETLAFIPAANNVDININSAWPHPEFIGAFLPEERQVSGSGFRANWEVNRFASNIGDKVRSCESGGCQGLRDLRIGVRLIEPVDVYLQSERSVKYGVLFVGLSFVAFFLFEHLRSIRIHPIQYGLVGFSIATFYLLLLSLSEHIHFGFAYAIATLACVLLNFLYLKFVLAGARHALYFCIAKIALFATLYVIIQAEDFALLMGAILVFAALAVVMLVTRRVDWYAVSPQAVRGSEGASEATC